MYTLVLVASSIAIKFNDHRHDFSEMHYVYFSHFWMFTVAQNLRIPSTSSAFVFGFVSTLVAPFKLIPAHTCTLTGCFAFGLFFGASPILRQQNRRWDSSCTVHSSVQMTSLKSKSVFYIAHSSRFCLLTVRISWQYDEPLKVQPRMVLHRRIVLLEML